MRRVPATESRILILMVVTACFASPVGAQDTWDPRAYNSGDQRGTHFCLPVNNEIVYEAKEVSPLSLVGRPDLASFPFGTAIAGHVLIEAIIDKEGLPTCASAIRTDLPQVIVEDAIKDFMKCSFSAPTTRDGVRVSCYYYYLVGYGPDSGC